MRTLLLAALIGWAVAKSGVAAADLKDPVRKALEQLAGLPNYSWTSTTKSEPNTSLIRQSPTDGKTEREGFTYFRFALDGNSVEAAFKGTKSAIKTETTWESSQELKGDRQWIARRLQAFKTPWAEAEDLLKMTQSLRSEKGGAYPGELTAEGVNALLLSRSRDDTLARVAPGAKGSAKFWVKNGLLVKYEYSLQGKILLIDHQQQFNVNRTTTVEIKKAGSTKVQVPEEAKEKLL